MHQREKSISLFLDRKNNYCVVGNVTYFGLVLHSLGLLNYQNGSPRKISISGKKLLTNHFCGFSPLEALSQEKFFVVFIEKIFPPPERKKKVPLFYIIMLRKNDTYYKEENIYWV